jgi:hypothetical protein
VTPELMPSAARPENGFFGDSWASTANETSRRFARLIVKRVAIEGGASFVTHRSSRAQPESQSAQ